MRLSIPRNPCAESLAGDYVHTRAELRRASKVLHDDVGSLLAAAGIQLQLLQIDTPSTRLQVNEIIQVLDGAMESVRALSTALDPAPVRAIGLGRSLEELLERRAVALGSKVTFKYAVTAKPPVEIAASLYQVTALVLAALPKNAGRVILSVAGSRGIVVRIQASYSLLRMGHDFLKVALMAKHAGFDFEIRSGKVTIISIRYAVRRSVG